jgi:glycosyltransferase involved in cell wall biosynthesis
VTQVHLVVPDGIDDPARPSGGNVYDRHLCRGLTAIGWTVHEHAVALDGIPDDALVLVDGLVASPARRRRLVVLVHMPQCDERERAVLEAATAVITTSAWSRQRLLDVHGLPADRVHVATPGVEAAELAGGTGTGEALLCVAAVTPEKGHDVLLDALATITDLSWRCECVGSLEKDRAFVERLRRHAIADRVTFTGPRTGADLDRCYAAADLLVLPSRTEAYGMVVTEALARGVPVIASDVGGVGEALGHGGLFVPPEDPAALGAALQNWLGDASLRERLREAARERRTSLSSWSITTEVVASVLR